jgi:hypothetical protein
MSLQRPFLTCVNNGWIYCIHVLMMLYLFFVGAVAWTQHTSVFVGLTHDAGGAILGTLILKLVTKLSMLNRSLCMRQDSCSSFLYFENSIRKRLQCLNDRSILLAKFEGFLDPLRVCLNEVIETADGHLRTGVMIKKDACVAGSCAISRNFFNL